MKYYISLLFAIWCSCTCILPASASHQAGLDMTLTCTGGNNYLITFALYRDCSGIPAPIFPIGNFECTSNAAIEGVSKYPGSKMYIYNRWGKIVYRSEDYNPQSFWNGSGHADGVYYYVFYLYQPDKGAQQYTQYHGSVTKLTNP